MVSHAAGWEPHSWCTARGDGLSTVQPFMDDRRNLPRLPSNARKAVVSLLASKPQFFKLGGWIYLTRLTGPKVGLVRIMHHGTSSRRAPVLVTVHLLAAQQLSPLPQGPCWAAAAIHNSSQLRPPLLPRCLSLCRRCCQVASRPVSRPGCLASVHWPRAGGSAGRCGARTFARHGSGLQRR